ncbi:hypothetical protein BaRGS_00019418 [Batillaria attramentaria]|uniref:Serpin domain-containing protein n=1 Tax=Batillaria attramentaria TaxID=370345 RepID=A0ABD0KRE5_9CAEN
MYSCMVVSIRSLQNFFDQVNERGTKAAAVTSVGATVLSLPPQFRANHPFLVVLRDKTAKMNIFIGRLSDPTTDMV